MKEILEKFSNGWGISGYEDVIRNVIKEEILPYTDEIKVDRVGNLIGAQKGMGTGKLMIATHMDELGFLTTMVEDGYLRFTTVGGFDKRILPEVEVVVHSTEDIEGVIGAIPPHFLSKKKQSPYKIDELFIDIGMEEEEIKKRISVGTPVSVKQRFISLNKDFVSGKALDNRASCAVLTEILKKSSKIKHPYDIYAVFTIQEEETGLGAISSSYGIYPDIAFAMDATHGTSIGVGEDIAFPLDKGTVIAYGPNIHPEIFERLVKIAEKEEIDYNIEPVPGRTGTDATGIQIAKEGIPTGLISIPLRYMHTPVEVVNMKDMERTVKLMVEFITEFEGLKGGKHA